MVQLPGGIGGVFRRFGLRDNLVDKTGQFHAGWWPLWPLFLVGAVAMRAAGCVYNDIVDRDLDAKVARTASRPVASGAVSVRNALTRSTTTATTTQ